MFDIREEKDLNSVASLWQALNRHNQVHSRHFESDFRNQTFDNYILKYNDVDDYRLEVVYREKKPLGFILGSIKNDIGEIDSFYLYDDLRGLGLGEYLMKRMILWLKASDVKTIQLDVAAGNEEVIMFYQKMGFYTEKYTMRLGD